MAEGVLDAVLAHARAAAPQECCGLLVGSSMRIARAVPSRNLADDPTRRFLIDPQDHIAVRRDARAAGLDVCGFYHSHPRGKADASATDVAEATYPDALYLVAGMAGQGELRIFRFTGDRFVELRMTSG